tara:strand:+ start:26226 stop:26375 length:150 start_codon:yes stop_codon:yes gene_type:complete
VADKACRSPARVKVAAHPGAVAGAVIFEVTGAKVTGQKVGGVNLLSCDL